MIIAPLITFNKMYGVLWTFLKRVEKKGGHSLIHTFLFQEFTFANNAVDGNRPT